MHPLEGREGFSFQRTLSLRLKESSCSLFLLYPHFPVCHHSTSFQLSSPTVSFSAGLLAWCVCHVQRQQVCDEEAPSSGILNFSHSNKGWCCQKVLWLLGFCVNRSFVAYCYEEAIKQWPHHSLTGYTVWGKS